MTSKHKIKSVQEFSLDVIADQDEHDSEGSGIAANEESKLKQNDENSYGEVSLDVVEEGEYSQQQINEKNLENEIKYEMDRKNWEVAYKKLKELSTMDQSNPDTFRNMALCEKNLGMFIQSVRSLQTAADLDIKMPTSKTSKAHYKENEIILNLLNDI